MKFGKILIAAIMACAFFAAGPALAADDYYLEMESCASDGSTPKTVFLPNEEVWVHILAGNNGGALAVAGAAFTLEYPADVLTGPATDGDGVPTGDSITSIFPFQYSKDAVTTDTFRANSSVSGTVGAVYFAGAAIDESTGTAPTGKSNPQILFSAKFTVKSDATLAPFNLVLKQTQLYNPDAGYGAADDPTKAPEPVAVLVGALAPSARKDVSADFPVLLGNVTYPYTNVTLPLDLTDGDSIDDAWERNHFGDLTTATDLTDWDGDGYLDKWEQTSYNNTDPNVQDAAWGTHYDPATDNRGPYQVVTGNPAKPRALAGESFTFSVNYETTDDGSGVNDDFVLTLHYNSTDLTYSGVANLTGNATTQTDASIAADSVVTITIPAADLSATLYDVTFTSSGALADDYTSTLWFTATTDSDYAFHAEPVVYTVGPAFTLDIDGNGTADSMTDGIMIVRYLLYTQLGIMGPGWSANLFSVSGDRNTEDAVKDYLDSALAGGLLDVDGNGTSDSMTDGIMAVRYLLYTQLGIMGPGWSANLFSLAGTRNSEAACQTFLDGLMP